MGEKQKAFFEKTDIPYTCDRCETLNYMTFRDVGGTVTCRKCGLVYQISKTLITEEDNADLQDALNEYLRRPASSEKTQ